jgi:hypothetical protein
MKMVIKNHGLTANIMGEKTNLQFRMDSDFNHNYLQISDRQMYASPYEMTRRTGHMPYVPNNVRSGYGGRPAINW